MIDLDCRAIGFFGGRALGEASNFDCSVELRPCTGLVFWYGASGEAFSCNFLARLC